jgi:hypothetical protein
MKSLDFEMRKILDISLSGLGVEEGSNGRRLLSISGITGVTDTKIHVKGSSLVPLDPERSWVSAQLVKIPSDIITRGTKGLIEKEGLYTIKVETSTDLGEYLIEAISASIEEHFSYNMHIASEGILLTINKTWQQPSIFINKPSNRYWNRIYVGCIIYDKEN